MTNDVQYIRAKARFTETKLGSMVNSHFRRIEDFRRQDLAERRGHEMRESGCIAGTRDDGKNPRRRPYTSTSMIAGRWAGRADLDQEPHRTRRLTFRRSCGRFAAPAR